jgi:hypothetical protein
MQPNRLKFRAWAEKTVNNRWNYAYPLAEAEKKESEDPDFDEYESRAKFAKQWQESHSEDEVYTKTKEMITNITVNGEKIIRPYSYEILTVMQSTGLLDKNGVEIFEGDIVKKPSRCESQPFITDIFWREGIAGWGLHIQNMYIDSYRSKHWEIIGNIYENPEFLTN